MPATRQISITLPDDMMDEVRARVASGQYANESEVILEGLLALNDREHGFEHWLRTEGVAAYDELKANPSNVHSVEDVHAMLDEEWDRAGRAG